MRQSAGSNDQLACLRDGHEITRDVLVRNGDGTAFAKLTPKQRDNRTVATKNIAKANSRKDGLTVCRVILNDHLVHTLGGTHYVRGVNGLIGRNLHVVAALVLIGKAHDVERAKNVILDCLAGVALHKRNVLVGCSVENNLRMVLLKDLGNRWEMRNGTDIDLNISALITSGLNDVVIQLVGSVLVNVEQHDLRRLCRKQLTYKLGTNRSATARNQNALASNVTHLIQIKRFLLTGKQIADLNFAKGNPTQTVLWNIPDIGQRENPKTRFHAEVVDPLTLFARGARYGYDNLLRFAIVCNSGNILTGAANLNIVNALVLLIGVVIHNGNRVTDHVRITIEHTLNGE